jgi:type II secretory pathway pseudopilin PulG
MQHAEKKEVGYTILEVVLAFTIALILAATITAGMRNFMVERSIEKEAVTFWKELCTLRAKAMKNDVCYFVKFNTGNNTYTVWKDANVLNCQQEDGNDDIVPNPFPAKIEYGIPSPAPPSGPDGTSTPAAAIENDWAVNGIMKVENDDIGTIDDNGRVCLSWERLPKIGYCIQVKSGSQNIKLFKWNGSSWIEM